MVDITEIYVHWYAGRSKSELAASLGVDRKTIRKYLEPAEASGITPGGPPMREADWASLIKSWYPELADRRLRQITWPDIDQHRDYIKNLLGTVTVSTIHQRLRDEHKLDVSISSFRRWVHATLPDETTRSQVTVLRDDVEPNALYRLRAAQGILGLKKKYGDARLEAACARAIAVGDPSYRTIKGILVAGTETDPEPESSGDAGAAAFLDTQVAPVEDGVFQVRTELRIGLGP